MTIEEERRTLTWMDWLVICAYFVCCIGAGLWAKFFRRKGPETAESYFLAGRSMLWWAVGGSLFASNIGSEHFIGLAGSGAATGIAVASYEWQASWILLLLGWLFVPIYLRSKIFTMPEYLHRRFQSKWVRAYLTFLALFNYIFTKVSVDIYAGGLFLYEAIGWNIYISSAVILVITALYTVLGGLAAVVYTDTVQCAVMISGAIVLSAMGFDKIGGMNALWEKYPMALGKSVLLDANATYVGNITHSACYDVPSGWGHMFRPVDDPHYPWVGLWFSLPIIGIWYWCTDQVIVQRALGAKNNIHAKSGTIFAGYIKTLPLFIMVMPGMISRVLYQDDVACPDPESCRKACDNENGCTNLAYPKLVVNLLPQGLVGLMLAVMIAALMSSLSSAFNSSSTIFTVDIWQRFRPHASNKEMLIVGRIVVFVLVGVGIVWIPVIRATHGGQLFVYIQTVITYLSPPITAAFLLGILWTRTTDMGICLGMVIGLILGLVRFTSDNLYKAPSCGEEDTRPGFVKLHFMYFGIVLFVVSAVVMAVVSFFTEPVPVEALGGLTWSTLHADPVRRRISLTRGTEEEYCPSEAPVQLKDVIVEGQSVTGKKSEPDTADPDELVVFAGYPLEEESPAIKWTLRIFTIVLLAYLAVLWVYYR